MASGDKTEKATPKRRQDERKKGNIFQSRDVTGAFGLLVVFAVLSGGGGYMAGLTQNMLVKYLTVFSGGGGTVNGAQALYFIREFVLYSAILSIPLMLAAAVTGVAADALQTRLNFVLKRLKPDLKKINPVSGLKKLITLKSLVELLKSALKVAVIGGLVYNEIKARVPEFLRLGDKNVTDTAAFIVDSSMSIGLKACVAMVAIGVLDYLYQWWSYERQIMMTKQEIKDEFKQSEGDPHIKGKVREIQRKRAMSRMMGAVPSADVVIKNPTHFAVALRYEKEKNGAPVVIAKGQDYLALKIIETAEKHDVPVTANPPLARGLYAATEIGQEIPHEFYQAVAEVLAFVYKLKKGSGTL